MSQDDYEIIRPSGEIFGFDANLASAYGVQPALLIQHFQYWIRINKRKKQNLIEGRTWTYNSYDNIAEFFPFFTAKQVITAINNLEKYGVIIKGNYNKKSNDPTLWFAFTNEDVFLPEFAAKKPVDEPTPNAPLSQESCENEPPIPADQTVSRADQTVSRADQTVSAIPITIPVTIPKKTNHLPAPQTDKVGQAGGLQKSEEIKIYACLQDIEISKGDKIRLTSQYDEKTVAKSVSHCMKPNIKINKSLDGLIFHFCANPDHIKECKEDIQVEKVKAQDLAVEMKEKHRGLSAQVIKKFWNNLREFGIIISTTFDKLTIRTERMEEEIYFDRKTFINDFWHSLQKSGFDMRLLKN